MASTENQQVDIYADDKKPITAIGSVRVTVVVPMPNGTPYKDTARVLLDVEMTSGPPYMTGVVDWYWFGNKKSRTPVNFWSPGERTEQRETELVIYQWLTEWEFIELRPIGPEDSEYFATDELMAIINKAGV